MSTTIRIVREPSNQDGWIGRKLSSNRVVFLRNLSDHITKLVPGQIWSATIIESRAKVDIVSLDSIITH